MARGRGGRFAGTSITINKGGSRGSKGVPKGKPGGNTVLQGSGRPNTSRSILKIGMGKTTGVPLGTFNPKHGTFGLNGPSGRVPPAAKGSPKFGKKA